MKKEAANDRKQKELKAANEKRQKEEAERKEQIKDISGKIFGSVCCLIFPFVGYFIGQIVGNGFRWVLDLGNFGSSYQTQFKQSLGNTGETIGAFIAIIYILMICLCMKSKR